MISSEAFEHECQSRIMGHLFEDEFNADYQEQITLTIKEMRDLTNLLRKSEGLKPKEVTAWVDLEGENE